MNFLIINNKNILMRSLSFKSVRDFEISLAWTKKGLNLVCLLLKKKILKKKNLPIFIILSQMNITSPSLYLYINIGNSGLEKI